MTKRLLFFPILYALLPLVANAQSNTIPDDWEITNVQMLGIGASNVLDTYLSPEKYNGSEIRYISHTIRQKDGKPITHTLIHEGNISSGTDRSEDGTTLAALYDFRYAMQRCWNIKEGRLRIETGGMLCVGAGAIQNTRNQNNPAQMRLFSNIGPSATVTWRFNIRHRPFALRYEAVAPVLGVMFSPNYGQSYYEIFSLGNYDHNAVITYPGNAPSLRHSLTADFSLWGLRWRLGYLGDFQQASVNNLKQHVYTHALMIGFVKHFKITNIQP